MNRTTLWDALKLIPLAGIVVVLVWYALLNWFHAFLPVFGPVFAGR